MIDMLGGGPVHYCGESLGGILGIVLAARAPEKLRTLTLVAAPVTIPKATQEAFALGHASWQDALRALGSKGWSLGVNAATRFPPGTDPGAAPIRGGSLRFAFMGPHKRRRAGNVLPARIPFGHVTLPSRQYRGKLILHYGRHPSTANVSV